MSRPWTVPLPPVSRRSGPVRNGRAPARAWGSRAACALGPRRCCARAATRDRDSHQACCCCSACRAKRHCDPGELHRCSAQSVATSASEVGEIPLHSCTISTDASRSSTSVASSRCQRGGDFGVPAGRRSWRAAGDASDAAVSGGTAERARDGDMAGANADDTMLATIAANAPMGMTHLKERSARGAYNPGSVERRRVPQRGPTGPTKVSVP